MAKERNYWLLKSEADCYSIDDFKKDTKTLWNGVRNFQARNFIRDGMNKGDMFLFYHSSCDPLAVVGVGEIVSHALPDPTAFQKSDEHFDAKSRKDAPTWYTRQVTFKHKFKEPVTLGRIKLDPKLKGMMLTQVGSRLSVQPVSKVQFEHILKLAK